MSHHCHNHTITDSVCETLEWTKPGQCWKSKLEKKRKQWNFPMTEMKVSVACLNEMLRAIYTS